MGGSGAVGNCVIRVFLLLCVSGARAIVAASEEPLKLLISVEQTQITAPFPARATLHFHNASKQALWLYRRVRSQAKEGSTVEVRLEGRKSLRPHTAVRWRALVYRGPSW